MPRVLFLPAARADLADALAWYGTHAPQMVPQFRAALGAVVRRMEENPRQFRRASHNTRHALMRRFPYVVIFRDEPEAAYVIAIFHASRAPRSWQGRLP
ncbi:type II toxin-antitoxin system RelE/ParE family toxin [Azorhizobium caulinodans]|uniref:type II toxin-antitoxin system RelE/ParE family toxin n=1 Tax=Azorhizobium caulinodans TaxID=7 RepID=UPI0005C4DD64